MRMESRIKLWNFLYTRILFYKLQFLFNCLIISTCYRNTNPFSTMTLASINVCHFKSHIPQKQQIFLTYFTVYYLPFNGHAKAPVCRGLTSVPSKQIFSASECDIIGIGVFSDITTVRISWGDHPVLVGALNPITVILRERRTPRGRESHVKMGAERLEWCCHNQNHDGVPGLVDTKQDSPLEPEEAAQSCLCCHFRCLDPRTVREWVSEFVCVFF